MSTCRRSQIDPYLSSFTKLKSKWNKNLNLKLVSLNMIEEKVGNNLQHIDTRDHFLNITPVVQTLRVTISKWNLLKLKSYHKTINMVKKTKTTAYRMEKHLHQPHI